MLHSAVKFGRKSNIKRTANTRNLNRRIVRVKNSNYAFHFFATDGKCNTNIIQIDTIYKTNIIQIDSKYNTNIIK